MLTGDSVFVISCVNFASSPFAQEVLFVVSLLIALLSRFGGVRHLVKDFLLYKVVSEVVEVAVGYYAPLPLAASLAIVLIPCGRRCSS